MNDIRSDRWRLHLSWTILALGFLACGRVGYEVGPDATAPDPTGGLTRPICGLSTTSTATALVAFFPLDEAGSSVVEEASGKGPKGALLASPRWVPGKFGSSLLFSAYNDRVEFDVEERLALRNDLTVSFWVNFERLREFNQVPILAHRGRGETASDNTLFALAYVGARDSTAGTIRYFHEADQGRDVVVDLALNRDSLSLGTWHHISIVRDSAARQVSLFLDGVFLRSGTYRDAPAGGEAGRLILGSDGATDQPETNAFLGCLDEVHLLGRILRFSELECLSGSGE
jgi:hypothetical protein